MPKRKVDISFELEESLAERLTQNGFFENTAHWLEARVQHSDTVASYLHYLRHEIAADLTAIVGYASLLEKQFVGELNAEQTKFLQKIHAATERMENLLIDFTDAEVMEAEGLHLSLTSVPIYGTALAILNDMKERFESKEQAIQLSVSTELPNVWSTHYHLKRLLEILLLNAHRYTHHGGRVEICAEVVDDMMHIQVIDNGIGIHPDHLERIFQKFYRAPIDEVYDQPGRGLGLTLARQIVNGHGGEIWIESLQGTTAHVLLPLAE